MTKITTELDVAAKPVIFISYSHLDEPTPAPPGAEVWLTYVQSFLQPAMKYSVFDLWTDDDIPGGAKWKEQIKDKLAVCDICILLVSRHSLNSPYCMDIEIETIRERQKLEKDVHIFPIMLSPVPKVALTPLEDLNVRPKNRMPLSGLGQYDRDEAMSAITDEIAAIAAQIAKKKAPKKVEVSESTGFEVRSGIDSNTTAAKSRAAFVIDTAHLPETAYEKLQGRDEELKRLDRAWSDRSTNILSLIAEGGAGKSALVNEWLKRIQADNYRGAEAVLGWSFYSQGTKERATSAEQFLNWALEKLGIKIETTNATAKGESIAEALAQRRVLLVLDGCEPLQHGLDRQLGELKDQGLRALLRRFASTPPAQVHGLVVLTSRLAIKDIARWGDIAAPVVDVDKLSDEAGTAVLRDNGVWGTDKQLKAAAHDFSGHPLALGLLASFLKEKHFGDVRRRDRIRAFFADDENPRHDHAKRVMESYESEWLAGEPVEHAIMQLVGLFDRPASSDCLRALCQKPPIPRLTDVLVNLEEGEWHRAVGRLREARLLAPMDSSAPDALDAHPLVREWFGDRLTQKNEAGWRAAHSRLYEHLRDTTKEGVAATLEDLAPLYQAIAHGCRAGRHSDVLDDIYRDRICRRDISGELKFYASRNLGASGSNLAAISWFFDKPFETVVAELSETDKTWVLGQAAFQLGAQGRLLEALQPNRANMLGREASNDWPNVAISASNLCEDEITVGNISAAIGYAEKGVECADRSNNKNLVWSNRAVSAYALHASGRRDEARALFADAERRLRQAYPQQKLLYSTFGYWLCDLLLDTNEWVEASSRARETINIAVRSNWLFVVGLDTLMLGRAHLGIAVAASASLDQADYRSHADLAKSQIESAVTKLGVGGRIAHVPRALLARAAFRRSIGDWNCVARDLDEVEEIAEPGPMKLYLCDMALERARLALSKIEAFAPLNRVLDDSSPKPVAPDAAEVESLKTEAAKQLAIVAEYIKTCGYHRRDEELAELEAVLHGKRKFADLPPRV